MLKIFMRDVCVVLNKEKLKEVGSLRQKYFEKRNNSNVLLHDRT